MQLDIKVTEAISKLLVSQPFYAVLLMQLMRIREATVIPTAGTDGFNLFINPHWFGKLTIDERVFVIAHEVLHVVYQHPDRGEVYKQRGIGPDLKAYNPRKMNIAEDYIINSTLIEGGLKHMPHGGWYNPQYDHTWLADDLYCKLPDDIADDTPDTWDEHMPPGDKEGDQDGDGSKDASPGISRPSIADIQRALKSAEVSAKAQGKLPANLQRLVDSICEPQVIWRDQIRMDVSTVAGRDSATWVRPNRKRMALPPHVYMPGTAAHRAGVLVGYGDSSGSVQDAEWGCYFGELGAIMEEVNPEAFYIGSCDTEATEPFLVTSAEEVREFRPVGGGGTNMPAIFDKLKEADIWPDALIVLTDGYTPWGSPPPYEVIWVITTPHIEAPYGRTIHIAVNA